MDALPPGCFCQGQGVQGPLGWATGRVSTMPQPFEHTIRKSLWVEKGGICLHILSLCPSSVAGL